MRRPSPTIVPAPGTKSRRFEPRNTGRPRPLRRRVSCLEQDRRADPLSVPFTEATTFPWPPSKISQLRTLFSGSVSRQCWLREGIRFSLASLACASTPPGDPDDTFVARLDPKVSVLKSLRGSADRRKGCESGRDHCRRCCRPLLSVLANSDEKRVRTGWPSTAHLDMR